VASGDLCAQRFQREWLVGQLTTEHFCARDLG